jgi:imidazolonepropionase-like amidohydrolase
MLLIDHPSFEGKFQLPDIEKPPYPVIAFINGALINGLDDHPVDKAVVIVENGCIKTTGKISDVNIPDNASVFDIAGKTIMPGLIDNHVHVGNIAVSMDETNRLTPAVYVHKATQNLEIDLLLGFTTLRDAGGLDISFKEAIDQGLIRGPRLFLSVNPLTPTGGHFDERSPFENSPKPRNSIGIYPEICDGPEQVRCSARQALRRGADQIKVAASGGVSSPSDEPDQWQFTCEELKAAVEAAKAAGTYVMAHAYDSNSIQNCIKAGVKTIEHGNLLNRETAALMAKTGTYYIPTMTVYNVFANEGINEMDKDTARKLEIVHEKSFDALTYAVAAGVKIGSGSDIIGPFQHLKGREFSLKGRVMSPMDTIKSATSTNAEILGMADKIGSLTPGKEADLIVVDGNPLEDLTLFENGIKTVVLVMKQGCVYKNMLGTPSKIT